MTGRSVLVVQHEEVEGLGTIRDALDREQVSHRLIRAHVGDSVPESLGESCGLIVMGGPMGVYDSSRFPSLPREMRLIESALAAGRPVLGICLGSQLLAHVLGAEVRPTGRKEIGWHRVQLTPVALTDPAWSGIPDSFVGFHWHGDAFTLPAGSAHLASSDVTPFQAYRVGQSMGLLFHPEVTGGMVEDMVGRYPDELAEERLDGRLIVSEGARHLQGLNWIANKLFGSFVATL